MQSNNDNDNDNINFNITLDNNSEAGTNLENDKDDEDDFMLSDYYNDYNDVTKYTYEKIILQARITDKYYDSIKNKQTLHIIIDDTNEFNKINIFNKPISIRAICYYDDIINSVISFELLKINDNILIESTWKIHNLSNEGHCLPFCSVF
jgi:hypothetical protein